METFVSKSIEVVTLDRKQYPFADAYVTEIISPPEFVEIFSPRLVVDAAEVFLPGNFVLKGVKGSGKSMLLNLLKPELRIAYHKAKEGFPPDAHGERFIGAGINLLRSGAADFGQRPIKKGDDGLDLLPFLFADFVNYFIAFDILESLAKLSEYEDGSLCDVVGISKITEKFDEFACMVSQQECWFGYLDGVQTYQQLKKRISNRITAYRSFQNLNITTIPEDILTTKTTAGQPISDIASVLRSSNLISEKTNIYIRIDQYEELGDLEGIYKDANIGPIFRSVINKFIGRRDPNVSYKVGTRGYAWSDNIKVFGTTYNLTADRDYKLVDLGDVLRRKENSQLNTFKNFAEDVFRRRLKFAGYKNLPPTNIKLLPIVFGNGVLPSEQAKKYCGNNRERAITLNDDWPRKLQSDLKKLSVKDPLMAKLGESWVRMKGVTGLEDGIPAGKTPWEVSGKGIWKKERIDQALMQIAGRSAQRVMYSGAKDIITLSGANISVFCSICQQIWLSWSRSKDAETSISNELPSIESIYQAVAILEVSSRSIRFIEQEGGAARHRKMFIEFIGQHFSKELYQDTKQSYPGHNGFSLSNDEYHNNAELRSFLQELGDYGNLYETTHTTKSKKREQRTKWYMNPIYYPNFRLPFKRVKEPMYVSSEAVNNWINASRGIGKAKLPNKKKQEGQLKLGFEPEGN